MVLSVAAAAWRQIRLGIGKEDGSSAQCDEEAQESRRDGSSREDEPGSQGATHLAVFASRDCLDALVTSLFWNRYSALA